MSVPRYLPRFVTVFLLFPLLTGSGCVSSRLASGYAGPVERPRSLMAYYSVGDSYTDASEEVIENADGYQIRRITIATESGEVVADYYDRSQPNDELIFVFPILGGRNYFAEYFASYFARHGYDAVVVHRASECETSTRLAARAF